MLDPLAVEQFDPRVVRGFYEDEDVPDGFEPLLADDDDEDSEQLSRTVEIRHVWFYDTNGHEILSDPHPWAGKYIPIVGVYGEEKIVEGQTHLISAIRSALDPQQLYNFYKTGEAEEVHRQFQHAWERAADAEEPVYRRSGPVQNHVYDVGRD